MSVLGGSEDPEARILGELEGALEIGLQAKRNGFDASGGHVVNNAREWRGTLLGEQDALHSEKRSRPENRADVMRVLQAIQGQPEALTASALFGTPKEFFGGKGLALFDSRFGHSRAAFFFFELGPLGASGIPAIRRAGALGT